MKFRLDTLALVLGLAALAAGAGAQTAPAASSASAAASSASADHAAHHPAPAAAASADMTTGEVRRIDKAAGKITLRHGEIRNLNMPPMTMVFVVADPAMLDRVKVGDTIRFRAEQSAGTYRVTAIAP